MEDVEDMQDWITLDQDVVPGDPGAVLYLMKCADEYTIFINGRELMSNGLHGSEDALSDQACDLLENLEDARILVGGLGLGFALAAALKRIGPKGRVTVAELIPAVERWNRSVMGTAAGHPLDDPRCDVFIGDVGAIIDTPPEPWSAILLDVDNGPKALTRPYNTWLYSEAGLKAAWDALIPGGVLGIWSVLDDDELSEMLEAQGFDVEVIQFIERGRATSDNSGQHILWMAQKKV